MPYKALKVPYKALNGLIRPSGAPWEAQGRFFKGLGVAEGKNPRSKGVLNDFEGFGRRDILSQLVGGYLYGRCWGAFRAL